MELYSGEIIIMAEDKTKLPALVLVLVLGMLAKAIFYRVGLWLKHDQQQSQFGMMAKKDGTKKEK